MPAYRTLTDAQVENFLTKGYLVVKNCIDLNIGNRWISDAYKRLGYDPNDPSTWVEGIIWMHHEKELPIRTLAPRAWDAIVDVVGGDTRIETKIWRAPQNLYPVNSFNWSDAFIANFHNGADRPWQPPSAAVAGWHKDGGYFRHFLDSPEQGLLTLVMWTDMCHQGGGTFIAPDSIGVVARCMLEHPEGLQPGEFNLPELIAQCHAFEEVTGEAGDFVIMHPYMLHASSQNVIRKPRWMTNPPVVLKEPFNFNRSDPADFSLVEQVTLRALGLDRLDFQPAAPREQQWTPYVS
jgi:hypothetical protein